MAWSGGEEEGEPNLLCEPLVGETFSRLRVVQSEVDEEPKEEEVEGEAGEELMVTRSEIH